MSKKSHPISECQICQNRDLKSVLFLGFLPPVNTMPKIGTVPDEESAFPLELLQCPKCSLVQIGFEVDQNVLFPPEYPYVSGSTKILRENFADLYKDVNALLNLKADDLIVDIGSNDGTLLSNFKNGGHRVVGVEPSRAGDIANSKDIYTEIGFFNEAKGIDVQNRHGHARVVTAANVFAHIGDVHNVVHGIKKLLAPEGIFVSESHYLLGLVETLQYDTIYHEHLRYYSLHSLKHLFDAHELEIFDVKRIPTHGGSIRVYTARKGQRKIQPSVQALLNEEKNFGILDGSALANFRTKVIESKVKLYALLNQIRTEKTKIFGIGAPSRASTLVSYTGLNDGLVECVCEIKTSPKVGKYMPGTRIPVVDEARLYNEQPEYALLLSWHISDELRNNLRRNGYKGKFITPLPEPRILD